MPAMNGFVIEEREGRLICLSWNGIGPMPPVPEGIAEIADDAFSGRRFTSVVLPSTLERIGRRAFEKCAQLRAVQIPDRVTVIDVEAFNGCQSLEQVEFGRNLAYIQARAFWYCIRLRRVQLPSSLQLLGSRAFEGCDRLSEVVILNPGAEFDEYVFNETPYWHRLLSEADRAAPGRQGLTPECPRELVLPEGTTHIDLYAYARSRIIRARLPASLRTMGMCAFRDCPNLEEVSISPNTYCNYHLPLEPGEGIFAGCQSLHTVTIHGRLKNFTWDGASSPELLKGFHPERTFRGCTRLHRIIAWQVPLTAFPKAWVPYALNAYLEDEEREEHYENAPQYDSILIPRRDWLIARAVREGERPIIQYLCTHRLLDAEQWESVWERAVQGGDAPAMARLLEYRQMLGTRDNLAGAMDEL